MLMRFMRCVDEVAVGVLMRLVCVCVAVVVDVC